MPATVYGSCKKLFEKRMTVHLITPGEPAPDFEAKDLSGNMIRLSSYRGKKIVLLDFLRGFM